MNIIVVGGTSGLGKDIVESLSQEHEVLPMSRRTGFDVRFRRFLPDCDGIVFSLRYRGDVPQEQFDTEIFGPARVVEGMNSRCRSIVFISTVAAQTVTFDQPWAYHASKAALEQMVRYFAVKLGGVRVNAVAPSSVKRDSLNYADFNKFLPRHLPLKRMITSKDVVTVVRMLLDPDCPLTGQVLTVDGGMSLLNAESLLRIVHQKDKEQDQAMTNNHQRYLSEMEPYDAAQR